MIGWLDLYPGFRLKDSLSTEEMTIKHLLSHTTGLVPYAFDNLVEADIELPDIIARLNEVDISAPPGDPLWLSECNVQHVGSHCKEGHRNTIRGTGG